MVTRIHVGFQASPQKPVELVKRTVFSPIPECREGWRENVLSRGGHFRCPASIPPPHPLAPPRTNGVWFSRSPETLSGLMAPSLFFVKNQTKPNQNFPSLLTILVSDIREKFARLHVCINDLLTCSEAFFCSQSPMPAAAGGGQGNSSDSQEMARPLPMLRFSGSPSRLSWP